MKQNRKIDIFEDEMYKIVEKDERMFYNYTENDAYLQSESSFIDGISKTNATYNLTVESLGPESPRKALNKRLSLKQMYLTEPDHNTVV